MSVIDISNLHLELQDRHAKQNRIYEQVFRRVVDKIKYTNSQSPACQCLYTLPAFMFGVPLYEINACRDYILSRLSDHYFYTSYMPPNIIYINWQQRPVRDDDLGRTRVLEYPTHTKIPQVGMLDTARPLTIMDANEAMMSPDPDEEKIDIFQKIDSEFINKNTMNAGLFPKGTSSQGRANVVLPLQHRKPMPADLDTILRQMEGTGQSAYNTYGTGYSSGRESANNPGGINGVLI
jgi:hypothetical protein